MKAHRAMIVLILVCGIHSFAFADKLPSQKWDSLIDVAYKFSWYPKEDLLDLLEAKSAEYGQSLEEYCKLLIADLTNGPTNADLINADSFISGKPWRTYYRLSIAQFCLFLANKSEVNLENAKTTLSVLSGKKELTNVAFWYFLFQAYSDLGKKDRDAFVANVFHIWQDVILKLEIDDILMDSEISKAEFVKDLPYLYENIAHLIISRGIIEEAIPDLYPLSVIVMSMKDKLSTENGYKNIVKAIAERMRGLKSDNYNLNFAVAFVEATANQYEFEDEASASQIASKYNLTHTYYELALSWTDSDKGRAAILTQHMGFMNHITRRLIDRDPLLTGNPLFRKLPGAGSEFVNNAFALYDRLAKLSIQKDGFVEEGFNNKTNYIKAMHQLWDSSAKLLMTLSSFYETNNKLKGPEDMQPAESPLLQYLSFFQKYAEKNSEIVPDYAFFLAAYAANQLADLYRQASNYSTKMQINDLALAYQLQAVELFPMDISGILQLAHQTNQEGRINVYLQYVSPLASRLRRSKVASIWLESHSTEYKESIAMVRDVIPDLIDNAPFLVKFLGNSEESEEGLCRKTILMTQFLMALQKNHSNGIIEDTLHSIAKQNFSEKDTTLGVLFKIPLPEDLKALANSIPGVETSYRITKLKNELYGSTDNVIHSYLREIYYEIPHDKQNHLELMKKALERKAAVSN